MQEEENVKGAIQACQLLVQKFGNDTEPLIRERVALVLIWMAGMHREQEEYEAALSIYGEITELFGNDKLPTNVRKAVIEAEQSKISLLNKLNQYERGINACNTILQRHPENPVDPALNVHIRWVLTEKAFQLMEARKFEEAIAVFDEVERRFTFQKDADSRQSFALLLRNKAGCLRALGRHSEAREVDGFLMLAFGNDPEPSVRWHAQNSLYLSEDEDDSDTEEDFITAAYRGDLERVRELLEDGADIEAETETSETALMQAAWPGHTEVVKLLLERGAKVDAEDEYGDTSLIKAAYHGRLEVVRLLMEYGADINNRDAAGYTPLMVAAWQNHPQVVRFLLEQGAKVSTANKEGQTALSLAGSKEIRQLLKSKG